MRKTSLTILAAESAGTGGRGSHRADRDGIDPGPLDDTRHTGKANYLFFDRHVANLLYPETLTPDMWDPNWGFHSVPYHGAVRGHVAICRP